ALYMWMKGIEGRLAVTIGIGAADTIIAVAQAMTVAAANVDEIGYNASYGIGVTALVAGVLPFGFFAGRGMVTFKEQEAEARTILANQREREIKRTEEAILANQSKASNKARDYIDSTDMTQLLQEYVIWTGSRGTRGLRHPAYLMTEQAAMEKG